jgi:hypothetical protein
MNDNVRGLGGAVPLGQARVAIVEMHVIPTGAVDVIDGGLSLDGMNMHLRIVDPATGRAWLVPMSYHYGLRIAEDVTVMVKNYSLRPKGA